MIKLEEVTLAWQKIERLLKAVVAKGRKYTKCNHTIRPPHTPSSILGAGSLTMLIKQKKHGRSVEIHGYYDINVWYSCNDNTKTDVATERVNIKMKSN